MMGNVNTQFQEQTIRAMARQVILAAYNGGEGHIPSALSILDILYAIYFSQSLDVVERDDFILSKGHASLALYAVLSEKGLIPTSWSDNFGKFDSNYGGHPHRLKVPYALASTGSLGHGLPMATGIAYGKKITKSTSKTIVLLGDGELNEGTTWEASLFALHHRLNNLKVVIDYNESGNRAINLSDLNSKFIGLGWQVINVEGHNVNLISQFLVDNKSDKPTVIIAETIKGYRIKEMEHNPAWHHTKISKIKLDEFLSELK